MLVKALKEVRKNDQCKSCFKFKHFTIFIVVRSISLFIFFHLLFIRNKHSCTFEKLRKLIVYFLVDLINFQQQSLRILNLLKLFTTIPIYFKALATCSLQLNLYFKLKKRV